jgi:cellulose synthase/poly-beta-1,6-N-acetylglucosamine synthase-like glycosyltransferase/SAM-dependent methyltransferase
VTPAVSPPPTVSVVIPCYNLGAFLDQAVQSVLDQSFQDFEIVVVDDGSTEEATRLLFASYRRPRTRVIRTENRGLARARNLGIEQARGRYVSCLDADDLLDPGFLEKAVAALDAQPHLGFASCWLTAFGESSFTWTPESCDFPVLLSECTVCTAALQRRDAVLAAGGYDPGMPLPGYEDWDLAIGLIEAGRPGTILREPLFRYRIRRGSMSVACMEPSNHRRLLRYMVAKHHSSYRGHRRELLEITERRTAELARVAPAPPAADPPTVHASGVAAGPAGSRAPATDLPLTTVISSDRGGVRLADTLEAVLAQSAGIGPLIVLEAGGDRLPDGLRASVAAAGACVVSTPSSGPGARADALSAATTPYVVAFQAGDAPHPDLYAEALQILLADPDTAFATYPLGEPGPGGFVWTEPGDLLVSALAAFVAPFPFVRTDALRGIGGYAADLPTCSTADRDLAVRLAASGIRAAVLRNGVVRPRPEGDGGEAPATAISELIARHRAFYDARHDDVFVAKDGLRRRLEVHRYPMQASEPPAAAPATVEWGTLRRLEPVSRVWGVDRGQPVDRYYIERFLARHRADIRGRVLEVKDANYTRVFGSGVHRSDVLDVAEHNPEATLVADLEHEDSLPEASYDCFILTQTVHVIYDFRTVLRNAARTLAPGGVLLVSLPCVSRVDYESGLKSDFWRFTPASAERVVAEAFPEGDVQVSPAGNVLACCSFLLGLSAEELASQELDYADPYFPLLVCVRAAKGAPR